MTATCFLQVSQATGTDNSLVRVVPTPSEKQLERALDYGDSFQALKPEKGEAFAPTPPQKIPESYLRSAPPVDDIVDDFDALWRRHSRLENLRYANRWRWGPGLHPYPDSAWCWPPIACEPVGRLDIHHFGKHHKSHF